MVVGRRGRASAGPTRLWLLGCSSRAAGNLKGWGPGCPPPSVAPATRSRGTEAFLLQFLVDTKRCVVS